MARGLTFIRQLKSFLPHKEVESCTNTVTLGHNNPLEQQLKYNPETEELIEMYKHPTGLTNSASRQHDATNYSSCVIRRERAKI